MARFWISFLVFVLMLPQVISLLCHKCPPHEHRSAKACLAGPPQECSTYDTGCFFEYDKMDIRMGCGRDWAHPSGCYGTVCITWCDTDLCNEILLRKAPFETDLEELPKTDSPGILSSNWLDSLFGTGSRRGASTWIISVFVTVSFISIFL